MKTPYLFYLRPHQKDRGAAHAEPGMAHRFLQSLFGPLPQNKGGRPAGRPFLWRRFDDSQDIVVLSSVPLAQEPYDYAVDVPRPFRPDLRTGDRLQFSVRVNPVVLAYLPGKDGKDRRVRHDIVMYGRWMQDPQNPKAKAQIIRDEGFKWLAERAPLAGFAVEEGDVMIDGYHQHRMRPGPGKGRPYTMATIDYDGYLTVQDPDLFCRNVQDGLGPSKAYGCGLMLLKRA